MSGHLRLLPPVDRRPRLSRRERDEREADLAGLEGAEREAFFDRLEDFDANTLRLAALKRAEVMETREAMLMRIDALIAELVDQLAGEVVPWP